MKKKGIFFTLGLTLFAFVILALSLNYAKNSSSYDLKFLELSTAGRIYDLDQSLENSLASLFSDFSSMTYTASSSEAIFQYNLPYNFTRLNQSYQTFRQFANSQGNPNLVSPLQNNLSISVQPMGILFWQNLSRNSSHISYTINPPTSYSIDLNFFEANITSCTPSFSSGNFSLGVFAVGGNGSSCSYNSSINPVSLGSLQIGSTKGSFTLQVSNYSLSLIATNSSVAVTSRVGYNGNPSFLETLELLTPINVSIPGLIASKISPIRLS